MFLSFIDVINYIKDNIVWGIPLLALLLIVGFVLTFRLRGIQVTHLGESLKCMVQNDQKAGHRGEVSSFGALCISMAATLGTGKIIGVATAIQAGGPGALFWMIFAAIFGMATKYAEGFLAIRCRRFGKDGSVIGGPFTYIEDGMGKKWKWLAISFAIFGALAGVMGIGNMTQMNSINEAVVSVFDPEKAHCLNIFGTDVPICTLIITGIVTVISCIAIIGGITKISSLSVILVPVMAIGYFLACILIVIFNIQLVPHAMLEIVKGAFSFKAGVGAAAGIGIIVAMREGISKGIFSNEAGLGSAPIALASARTNNPVRSGLVCMSGTFVDTMVLCLTIGLGIVITGTYQDFSGIEITINSFSRGIGIGHQFSAVIVMLSIATFAFTTIIGWNVYGEKCIAYLTNDNKIAKLIYQIIYIGGVAITPFLTLDTIWSISSIFNGLMAIPNLIGLLALSGVVAKETMIYFQERKKEKQKVEVE